MKVRVYKYFRVRLTFLILIIYIVFSRNMCSQTIYESSINPNIILPSPTQQQFQEYGNTPMSLYNGTTNINIKLWDINAGKLKIPITLTYLGGGVKVDELPGIIGMRWNLSYGGSISRSIIGLPDDSENGWYNLRDKISDDPTQIDYQNGRLRDIALGCIDGQPDEYMIHTANISNKFFFDANNIFRTVPYRNIKIKNNNFNSFIVTDEIGDRYIFRSSETSQNTIYSDYVNSSQEPCKSIHSYKSSWMLDSIISYDLKDTVVYTYQNKTIIIPNKLINETFLFDNQDPFLPGELRAPEFYVNKTYTNNKYQVKSPHSIKTRTQSITFYDSYYDNINFGTKLDSIVIRDNYNKKIKKLRFEYLSISDDNRLTISKIIEESNMNNSHLLYEFTYNPMKLPNINSICIDHYGYFNGQKEQSSLIHNNYVAYCKKRNKLHNAADRSVDPRYNQAGILTKIKYPTGGYTEFFYETNRALFNEITSVKENNKLFRYDLQFSDEQFIPFKEDTITIESNTIDVSITNLLISKMQKNSNESCFFEIQNSSRNILKKLDKNSNEVEHLNLSTGKYYIRFYYGNKNNSGSIRIRICDISRSYQKEDDAGGVRIFKVIDADNNNTLRQRRFEYKKSDTTTSGKSVFAKISYNFPIRTKRAIQVPCPSPSGGILFCPKYYLVHYDAISSFSRSNIIQTNMGYVGYSQVSEFIKAENTRQRIVYKFTNPEDIKDLEGGDIVPFTPNTSRDYKRGLELEKLIYDENDNLKKRISNSYNFNGESPDPLKNTHLIHALKVEITGQLQDGIYAYKWESYDIISEWFYKQRETEYNYENGTEMKKQKTYKYNNYKHSQLSEITELNSDGKEFTQKIYYPVDFPSNIHTDTEVLTTMISKNINLPLKRENYYGGSVVSGEIINYDIFFRPTNKYVWNKNAYTIDTYFDLYDNYNNIIAMHRINGMYTTFIWDNISTNPVVKIISDKLNIPVSLYRDISRELSPNLNTKSEIDIKISNIKNQLSNLTGKKLQFIYTYQHLIGPTSSTTPHGVTTYYEYDSFGRLQAEFDSSGKVITRYHYNYKK